MTIVKSALKFILYRKYRKAILLTTLLVSFVSCNQSQIEVDSIVEKSGAKTGQMVTVSSVDVVANQLVINGTNLDGATSVRVTGPSGFDETFDIESQNSSQLIANSQSNITMLVNGLFSLIVSNAYGAATYTISFELQDGQVTAAKLSGMGAAAGDVLTYDGSSWGPAPLTGLSYEGTYDANNATDQTVSAVAAGQYYIVQTGGSVDPDGITRSNTYAVGDWAVYNGTTSTWDRVVGSSDVTSVNGQTGVVNLGWADFSKAGSLLSDIANVDVTGRNTGDILVWNGSNWIVQAAPVDTNTNAATICGPTQVLRGDGTCVALPTDTNAATLCAAGEYLDGDGTCQTVPAVVNAATLCNANEYLDGDGTCKAVPTDTDTDTNAGTLCNAGEYLDGDGTCQAVPTPTTSLSVGNITNAGGEYFAYQPNGVACADGEVLKWVAANTRWECATDTGGASADASQLRGEDLDPALATNTTTDGQILVWSQTNGRWEVAAAPVDTDTTYSAGTGLGLAGTTFNVDVGTGANQIVQLDGSSRLPAVDGSQLTNVNASSIAVQNITSSAGNYFSYLPNNAACTNGQVLEWNGAQGWICGTKTVDTDTTYSAGTGLALTGTTFDIDVGTGANQIVQLDGSGNLPALDGSALTNVAAATANSVNVDDITNGAGLYFTYQPNNAACSDGQVLKWSTANTRWECGSDAGAGGGDAASLRGEAIDPSLATNTTTDGQILVWSQTNSRWEVGAAPTDNDTTYSAGVGLSLGGTTFSVDAGTGANQIVQLDGSSRLPAVDGSQLTNVSASSIAVQNIISSAGNYFGYLPNNAACTNGEVLEWNVAQGWVCGDKTVDTNTNAGTICNTGEFLDGDGNCQTIGTFSQWTTSGPDIYYDSGNVGIGDMSPTGRLEVRDSGVVGEQTLQLDGAAGVNREMAFTTDDSLRWILGTNNVAEGGSNAGSHFFINRYDDTGAYLGTALRVERDTGRMGINTISPTQALTVAGSINVTTGNDICIDGAGCLSSAVSGGGETNTASNLGTGANVFAAKSGVDLQFRSLASADSSVTITQNANDIDLAVSVAVDELANGVGLYFGYQPNNAACTNGQVLEWNGAQGWVCGDKTVDTNTTYTAGDGLILASEEFSLDLIPGTALSLNGVSGALQSEWLLTGTDLSYSAGNVGIGTASPNAPLEVSGSAAKVLIDARDAATTAREGILQVIGARQSDGQSFGRIDFTNYDNAGSASDFDLVSIRAIRNGIDGGALSIYTNEGASLNGDPTDDPVMKIASDGSTYIRENANTNNSNNVLALRRLRADATAPGAGFGARLSFGLEGFTNDGLASAAFIGSQWENAQTNNTTDRDASMVFGVMQNDILSERMRLTSEGYLGIGTINPSDKLTVQGSDESVVQRILNTESTSQSNNPRLDIINYGGTFGGYPILRLLQSRGSQALPGPITSGDTLGELRMGGRMDTVFNQTSTRIISTATDNWSDASSPSSLEFYTTSSGTSISSRKMVLQSDGNLGVGVGIANEKVTLDGSLSLKEQASAPTLTNTFGKLFVKSSDSKLYFLDDAGVEYNLTAGGGGTFVTGATSAAGTGQSLLLANTNDTAVQNGVKIDTELGGTEFMGLSWQQDTAWTSGSVAADKDASLSFGVLKDNVATTAMTLSSDGYLGIGTETPAYPLDVVQDGEARINSTSYGGVSGFFINKALGTRAAPTPMVNNAQIGYLSFAGWDGDNFRPAAVIRAEMDGGVANQDTPGRLLFFTTADGVDATQQERMRIDSSGNIGVGTTTPEDDLQLEQGLILRTDTNNASLNMNVFWNGTGYENLGHSASSYAGRLGFDYPNGRWTLSTSDTAGADGDTVTLNKLFSVFQNGRASINTDTTNANLNVAGGEGGQRLARFERKDLSQPYVDIAGSGDAPAVGFGYNNAVITPWAIGNNDGTFQIKYGVDTLNGGTSALSVTNAGNVGIGLTNPSEKLEIAGSAAASRFIAGASSGGVALTTNDGGGNANITFNHNGQVPDQNGTSGRIAVNVDATETTAIMDFEIEHSVTGGASTPMTPAMSLRKVGSVVSLGVGTPSPGQELEVVGDVLATSYLHSSDRRLKDQIETTDGLDTIRKLRGVNYVWRRDGNKDSGVIAQEIEQVMPWLVFTHPETGMKSVQYDGLFGPVIEALKEVDENMAMFAFMQKGLKEQVEENTREIASLKEENSKLKEKVETLEARLERLEKLLLKE